MTNFVRKFITQDGPNGQLIVFRAGKVFSVTAPAMQATVLELEKHCGEIVSQHTLDAALAHQGIDRESGHAFLVQEIGLLVPSPPAEDTVTSVLVMTDLPSVGQMLLDSLRLPRACSARLLSLTDIPADDVRDPVLAVTLLADYRSAAIRALYRHLAPRPEAAFLTTYLDGTTFVIDGLYVPSRALPCHFCHRHRTASADRDRLDIQPASWIAVQQHLEQMAIITPAPLAVDAATLGVMAFVLRNEIESLLGIDRPPLLADHVGLAKRIDLNNGQRTTDKVFHWELCDCLHGSWS